MRIHTGPAAAQAAEAIDAKAFTCGSDIVFNSGEYDPESPRGQFLLAHELAHVSQQTEGAISMLPGEDAEVAIDPDESLEHEADQAAQEVLSGDEAATTTRLGAETHIQRHPYQGRITQYLDTDTETGSSDKTTPSRKLDGATLSVLERSLTEDELEILIESHLEDETIKQLVTNSDTIKSVTQESDGTIAVHMEADFSDDESSVTGVVMFPENAPAMFSAAETGTDTPGAEDAILDPNDPAGSWEQLTDSGGRADFVEQKLTPHVLEQHLGVEMLGVDTACGAGKNGIDGIAWDPDKETLHIIEAKWDSNGKSASLGKLGDSVEGTAQEDIQMTSGWIEEVWERGIEQSNINLNSKHEDRIKEITNGDSLEEAIGILIRNDIYEAVYMWASNDTSGKSVSKQPLTKFDSNKYVGDLFDKVINFKAGGVSK